MIKEKDYEVFASKERVNLMLSALARGDQDEVAKLRRTCPERKYSSLDISVKQPFEDLNKIFSIFCLICVCYANKVLMARAELTALIMTSKHTSMSEFKNLSEDDRIANILDMEEYLQMIEFKQNKVLLDLAYIKSAYEAFKQFCDTVEINYDHIANWINIPSLEDLPIGSDHKIMENISCKDEYIVEIKEIFLSYWTGSKALKTR